MAFLLRLPTKNALNSESGSKQSGSKHRKRYCTISVSVLVAVAAPDVPVTVTV